MSDCQPFALAVLQAAAQFPGQVNAINGGGAIARGTSEEMIVREPAASALQLQNSGLSAQSTSRTAPALVLGEPASIQTTAMTAPQQGLTAPGQPGSAVLGASGQQAAVTRRQSPATQPITSVLDTPSQSSSATSGNLKQQPVGTEGQPSAVMQAVQQQAAEKPLQSSATPTKLSPATSLSTSDTAPSRQQAGMAASQDASLATAPVEDDSTQQVRSALSAPCRVVLRFGAQSLQ